MIQHVQKAMLLLMLLLVSLPMLAQQNTITGQVIDLESNEPLPGVNILAKGTTTGTVSDVSGNYKLAVGSDVVTLVFSSIGYEPEEVAINGRNSINVSLSPDIQSLQEVVVVGYGTQLKKDLTGSVASISGEKLETRSVVTAQEALAGKLPGVQVQQTTGVPGSSPQIKIRGIGSISAGVDPLVVIDGFPGGDLSTINPADIESVEVLKDASAAAIYGSRGGNGVILVTTKKGTKGKAKVNLDVSYGVQEVANRLDLLSGEEWRQAFVDARDTGWVLEGGSTNDPNDVRDAQYVVPDEFRVANSFPNTDWQDEIFRTAPLVNMQLSVSGGSDATRYFISGNYTDQEGVIMNTGFERITLRSNIESDLSENVKVGLNLAPSYSEQNLSVSNRNRYGPVWNAISMPPIFPIKNPDGTFNKGSNDAPDDWGLWEVVNPVMELTGITNDRIEKGLLSTAYLEYEIIEGLTFRSNFGTRFSETRTNFFQKGFVDENRNPGPLKPNGSSNTTSLRNLLSEYTLNYSKTFGKHKLDVLGGYTAQKEVWEGNNIVAVNYVSDAVPTVNAGQISSGSSGISEWSLISYLGRVNYNFDDKYLLGVTFRRDGSSRFGQDNLWGNFPSASLGWVFSEEPFMEQVSSILSFGKLRASYGLIGNNAIGNYASYANIAAAPDYAGHYYFDTGKTDNIGYAQTSIENRNLGWEQTAQANIGLELGFFEDRIRLEADYYDSETEALLLYVPLPLSSGFPGYNKNIGKIRNYGFEVQANAEVLTGAFSWTTNLNISRNRNEVLALGPDDAPITSGTGVVGATNRTEVGLPVGSFYGYIVEGIYTTETQIEAAPEGAVAFMGYPIIRDVDEDGDLDGDDRAILGDNQPDFIFGFSNTFSYKGFSLNVVTNGSVGNKIFNGIANEANALGVTRSMTSVVRGRYISPENPGDGFPILSNYQSGNFINNSTLNNIYIEDGSFFRFRDVTLSYNLPTTLFDNLPLSSLRVYVNAHNLWTITDYEGYDPEVDSQQEYLSRGVDYGTYPVAKTFTFGINVGF